MKAAVIVKPYKVEIRDVEQPKPGDGEALIRVRAVGICGSDLHVYRGRHPFVQEARIPGHEFSGDVMMCSDRDLMGEKVVVEPVIPCGSCDPCLFGQYNVCCNLRVLGVHLDGGMAEYVKVPTARIYRLPVGLSYEEGAMVEPAAVAVHVVRQAGVKLGDNVVILGAGPIGLLVLQTARLSGASRIMITDVVDFRLEMAARLGADYTVNAAEMNPVYMAERLMRRVDVVIDVAGARNTPLQAFKIAKPHGRVVIVGFFEEKAEADFTQVVAKELHVVGSRVYRGEFPTAIRLVSEGKIEVRQLITHRFSLDRAAEAFETADKRKTEAVKVLVIP